MAAAWVQCKTDEFGTNIILRQFCIPFLTSRPLKWKFLRTKISETCNLNIPCPLDHFEKQTKSNKVTTHNSNWFSPFLVQLNIPIWTGDWGPVALQVTSTKDSYWIILKINFLLLSSSLLDMAQYNSGVISTYLTFWRRNGSNSRGLYFL